VANRDDLVARYLDAVDRELAQLDRPEIDTLFLGGGTPTHLGGAALQRLLEMLARRFQLAENYEWSIEANPEDIDDEPLDLLVRYGINRVSLGIQSFDQRKLHTLERGHTGRQACAVVEKVARQIANVSIDLIFAAPDESLDHWKRDLAVAADLPLQHVSTYALTFEKGTQFWNRRMRGHLQGTTETVEVAMYEWTREFLPSHGFPHYEISNFAQPGSQCRHNLAYWAGRGWFAAGPGAARFVNGFREVNHRSTTSYLKRIEDQRSPVAESEAITPEQYARERAAFGIRLIEGIDVDALAAETGFDLRVLAAETLARGLNQGLIEWSGPRLRLTKQGVMFADSVASDLLG